MFIRSKLQKFEDNPDRMICKSPAQLTESLPLENKMIGSSKYSSPTSQKEQPLSSLPSALSETSSAGSSAGSSSASSSEIETESGDSTRPSTGVVLSLVSQQVASMASFSCKQKDPGNPEEIRTDRPPQLTESLPSEKLMVVVKSVFIVLPLQKLQAEDSTGSSTRPMREADCISIGQQQV